MAALIGIQQMVYSLHVRNISSYFTNDLLRFHVSFLSRRVKEIFLRIWKGKLCYVALRVIIKHTEKVDACTIMRDPDTGRSRGFAFLTFEEPSSVNAVMVREHYLDGKAVRHLYIPVNLLVTMPFHLQIDPKRAIPREEHLRNTRYFVGGLAPATTSESMKAFFGTYGKVVDATVMVPEPPS